MLPIVDHCIPEPLATIVPATLDESTWVVDTGRPKPSAAPIVAAAMSSAAAPWPQVRCVLPIFSPTVTTMRFQPIIVPRPRAMATEIFTHSGMNLVAEFELLFEGADHGLLFRLELALSLSLSFARTRNASEARYMSLRLDFYRGGA